MKTVLYYMKAILSGAAAGVATFIAADTDGQITGVEWGKIALAVIAASGIVAAIPNGPKPDQAAKE